MLVPKRSPVWSALSVVSAAVIVSTIACGESSSTPTSPAAQNGLGSTNGLSLPATVGVAAASLSDPVTLKVTAPKPVSPLNDAKPQGSVTLVATTSTGTFAPVQGLKYRFIVIGPTGAVVDDSGPLPSPTYDVQGGLDFEKRHTWAVRAELNGAVGPWSSTSGSTASFIAPAGGYINGAEMYDPLIDGKTVGTILGGPVTLIQGQGARIETEESFIQYSLGQTIVEGEFSVIANGLGVVSSNEDPKLRVITMREGNSAINDNEYRMSVDKRGNGAIAWRFITGNANAGAYIETVGSERRVYPFHESLDYFVQASWRNQFFEVIYKEGGPNGVVVYDFGKPYKNQYTPVPHNIFIGSPFAGGDRGEASSLDGMTVRQAWASSRPRPASANK